MCKLLLCLFPLSIFLLCNPKSTTKTNSGYDNASTTTSATAIKPAANSNSSETAQTAKSITSSNVIATNKEEKALSIDIDQTAKYLYGYNTANAFEILKAGDKNSIKLVTDLKPGLLRFPGGTIANYYHVDGPGYGFKDSDVEDYGHRMMNKKITRTEKGRNFIYEYIDFAKASGLKEVIYVANVLTADYSETETAIDLLTDAGIKVIAVELGNELFSQTFRPYIKGIDGYLKTAGSFAAKLKKKYPGIKLGAPAAPMYADMSKNHLDWNTKLAAADFLDAVIFHAYPPSKAFDDIKNVNVQFQTVKSYLVNYLQQTLPAVVKKYSNMYPTKELWVTEWNLPVTSSLPNTMLHSLFITQFQLHLKALHTQYPNLTIATYHNLATAKDKLFSIINTLNNNVVGVNTNYDVFKNMVNSRINEPSELKMIKSISNECFVFRNTTADGTKSFIILNWSNKRIGNIFSEKITGSVNEIEGDALFSSDDDNDSRFAKIGASKIKKRSLTNQVIDGASFSVAPNSVSFITK